MAYRLEPGRPVADEVRRIAVEEIQSAIARCTDLDDPEERVHDLRKRCKRLRALVRLVRGELAPSGAYALENAAFRDAADGLGGMRDRQAMIETYDAVLDRFADEVRRARFAPIRRALYRKLREASLAPGQETRLVDFRARMTVARERVPHWPIEAEGFDALSDGLMRTYRRGRKAMKAARAAPTPESFHEWRKRAKYHWYHLRLIEPVAPDAVRKARKRARALETLLGGHHDLAVLRAELAGGSPAALDDPATAALVALIDRRMDELAADAATLGRKVFRRKPGAVASRIAALWAAETISGAR